MPNEELSALVAAELSWDPKIDSKAIAVSADNGIVTLRGTVGSPREKHEARKATERVSGVEKVINELDVRILNEHRREDADLRGLVLQALMLDNMVPTTVDATVKAGQVTLTGVRRLALSSIGNPGHHVPHPARSEQNRQNHARATPAVGWTRAPPRLPVSGRVSGERAYRRADDRPASTNPSPSSRSTPTRSRSASTAAGRVHLIAAPAILAATVMATMRWRTDAHQFTIAHIAFMLGLALGVSPTDPAVQSGHGNRHGLLFGFYSTTAISCALCNRLPPLTE